MINWFWKYNPLMRRLPVLMALLAGFMFAVQPHVAGQRMASSQQALQQIAGAKLAFAGNTGSNKQAAQDQKQPNGEEIPHFEPAYTALAQVAPLQLFLYQQAILPVILPLVQIAEQLTALVPYPSSNRYHRTLFRHIISPNAP